MSGDAKTQTRPEGFLDFLKGMTLDEIRGIREDIPGASPLDEVAEALAENVRGTDAPSSVVEKVVGMAKEGDEVAALLALVDAAVPEISDDAKAVESVRKAIRKTAEKFGASLPALEADDAGDGKPDKAKADGDDDDDPDEGDGDTAEKTDPEVAKLSDRLDKREAKEALAARVKKIAKPEVAKLVEEAVEKRIDKGEVQQDDVEDAVSEAIQDVKRAAEAMGLGESVFEGLEPTETDDVEARATEDEDDRTVEAVKPDEMSPAERAFYGV